MKVLLYSKPFFPQMGGVEVTTATLAAYLTRSGHECVVLTETEHEGTDDYPFQVVRRPSWRRRLELVRHCDVVHSNGSSVALYPYAVFCRKPFVWTHNGYQVSCVDGIGWEDGKPTPMTPWASLQHHRRRHGFTAFVKAAVKLGFRRFVARRVRLNIAGSHWVAKRQPLPRQVVAYLLFPLQAIRQEQAPVKPLYDFVFAGRLVEEKGVDVLLRAFARLIAQPGHEGRVLAIVGDGPMRQSLEQLALDLGIASQVRFLGTLRGDDFFQTLRAARIGVAPSVYEEPMGGISPQLLAAGKPAIVSERGGLAETIGPAGLTFPNGDVVALLDCMMKLLTNPELEERLRAAAPAQAACFREDQLGSGYVHLYEQAINC